MIPSRESQDFTAFRSPRPVIDVKTEEQACDNEGGHFSSSTRQEQTHATKGIEMTGTDTSRMMAEELARYGIQRVPAEIFLWKGYRYTNASDALSAAKRVEKP